MSVKEQLLQKIEANPENYSIEMLQHAMQNGLLDSYVAIPLIQARAKEEAEQRMMLAAQGAPQQGQPTVVDEIMQQAQQLEQPVGLPAMQSNLPVQNYAPGGIVALAEGSEEAVKEEEEPGFFDDPIAYAKEHPYMTAFNALSLIPGIGLGVRGLGLAGRGIGALASRLATKYPAMGPTMAGRQWSIPGGAKQIIPGLAKDVAAYPYRNPVKTLGGVYGANLLFGDDGKPLKADEAAALDQTAPAADTPAAAAAAAAKSKGEGSGGIGNLLGGTGFKYQTEDEMVNAAKKGMDDLFGKAPKVATYEEESAKLDERLAAEGYDKDLIKTQREDLEKSRKKLGDDKAFATNMRILEAGLGIMSGTSQYGFVNMKGALPALQGLGEDINKINALDRDIAKEQRTLAMEQNKIAAGRVDAKQANVDKSLNRLDKYNKERADYVKDVTNNMRTTNASLAGHLISAGAQKYTADAYSQNRDEKTQFNALKELRALENAQPYKDALTVIRMANTVPDYTKVPGGQQKYEQALAIVQSTNARKAYLQSMVPDIAPAASPISASIPPGAIEDLQKNPKLAAAFDAKYGPGSAARYLRAG